MRQEKRSKDEGGFTLIELLVTVSIFVFMTALIIARYGSFNQGTLMTNLAYDIALSIRTTQTFGVSVKGIEDTGNHGFTQNFSYPYAVHFDLTTSVPASFFTYLDIANAIGNAQADGLFEKNLGDVVYNTYGIGQSATVSGLCVGTNGQACSGSISGITSLDISFRRPDPSAIICPTGGNAAPCTNGVSPYNYAEITLTSADGSSSRVVAVRGNGQISVITTR